MQNEPVEYEGAGATYYDLLSRGVKGDVELYVEEARRSGGPVLELGCGTGRITFAIAEAGVAITGVDLAAGMLAIARQKVATRLAPEVRERVELKRGDMRSVSLGRKFSLVAIPYRSFMHLVEPEDQKAALAVAREHLVDGGRLVLDIFDARLEVLAEASREGGEVVRKAAELVVPGRWNRVIVTYTRRYDALRQVLEGHDIFEELDDKGAVVAKVYTPRSQRLTGRFELQHLLELSGFEVESLFGDFARGPFKPGGDQIWIAKKK